MANRPWVTPDEVRAYSDYPSVQQRGNKKLYIDIARAEQYIISYTNNKFDDEKFTNIPDDVKTAVILIAEMYAFNASQASEGVGAYQSETHDDYSYTLATTSDRIDNLVLGPLLDDYTIVEAMNGITARLRKL